MTARLLAMPSDTGHPIFTRLDPRRRASSMSDKRRADEAPAAEVEPEPTMPAVGFAAAEDEAPGWSPLAELERVAPHAIALLRRVWGKPQAAQAFRALILDGDGRARRWPKAAWAELVLLRNVHQCAYPARRGHVEALVDPATFSEIEVGYPHVAQRLVKCWGNPEAFAVVHHDLVFDKRGNRAGWPAAVWDDLVLLQKVHDKVYGALPPGAEPWNSFNLMTSGAGG